MVMNVKEQLIKACEEGNVENLRALLSEREPVDRTTLLSIRDSQSLPLLSIAVSRCPSEALPIVEALLEYGAPPDIQDNYGRTPLQLAVVYHQNGCIKLLLKAGANILHVDGDGNNVIHSSAYACNDYATNEALKAGVDPTQPNNVGRIGLLDMVEKQPRLAWKCMNSKILPLANYMQYTKVQYDFKGLDYRDAEGIMDSPLEAMVKNPASNFLLSHMLVKRYLAWQWRLYGNMCLAWQLVTHTALAVLVAYVVMTSKLKLQQRPEASLHRYECCSDPSDGVLNVLRAVAELLLVPLTTFEVWRQVQEYVKGGYAQVRVRGGGNVVLRSLFRTEEAIYMSQTMVFIVPRYLLDVWNLVDLGTLLFIVALVVLRLASIALDDPLMPHGGYGTCLALLVLLVCAKLLPIVNVFHFVGAKLCLLRRLMFLMFENSLVFYPLFLGVSMALFLLLPNGQPPIAAVGAHSTITKSLIATFQVVATRDFEMYTDVKLVAISWAVLPLLLLLTVVSTILTHGFKVSVKGAEQEWLAVFSGYLLKRQRLLGISVVQRLKVEDLRRCHVMGGFDRPCGEEADAFLSAAPAPAIPAHMMIIWEDTRVWRPQVDEPEE